MPGKKVAKQSASSNQAQAPTTNGAERHATSDAGELLTGRHKAIKEAAAKLEGFKPTAAGLKDLRALCIQWAHHSAIETEIAYPAFLEAGVDEAAIGEAQIAHDLVAVLMTDLTQRSKGDKLLVPGVRVLLRLVAEVIDTKGEKSKGLVAAAKEAGVDMTHLGESIQKRMSEDETAEETSIDLEPRHLRGVAFSHRRKQNEHVSGHQQDRDPSGRFLPDREQDRYSDHDQDRRYSRSRDGDDDRRSYSRMRHDDERGYRNRSDYDDRRSSRYREDDDDRRPMSSRDDDDRRYESRASGRYDDDHHRYATRSGGYESERSRGYESERSRHGGWFGDPQGHAEASRRGWDERRSRDEDDDVERRMMRRRRYE